MHLGPLALCHYDQEELKTFVPTLQQSVVGSN
jgi:hypothetical protein